MSLNTPVGTWIPTNNTTQSGAAYLNNIDADVDVLSRLAALFLPQALPTPTMQAQILQGHVSNAMAQPVTVTASTTSGSTALGSLSTMAGLTIGMSVAGTGIQAGTTIAGLNAAGTATLSASATATAGSDVLTMTPPSTLIEVGAVATANTTSGSATLGSLSTVQGIQIGMVATVFSYVAGVFTLAAPSGSLVTAVTANSVTLDNAATSTVAGAWCTFAQAIGVTVTGTVTSGANTLGSLTTTSGMFVGMVVSGSGIPANTTIAGITGPNAATMSANATSTHAGTAITVGVPVPASNSRLDRVTVSRLTGQASWIAGTAAASPVPPAIPLGQVPIAQLLSTTSSTALTNTSSIWDERDFAALGVAPGEFGPQTAIASAATCDLGSVGANNVLVTGTTAITSLGSSASPSAPFFLVQFAASLTLTYNATSLILPGGGNIVTAANDTLLALYLGGGNWRVLSYMAADGSPASITGAEATIASAATVNLGAAGSNLVAISGTTAITSFGASASLGNPLYWVRFTGALTLTYNSTSLILPGSANITTAVGDALLAEYLGSGNWRVHYYAPATGKAVVSPQLQHQVFTSSGTFTAGPTTGIATNYKITVVGGGGGGGGSNGTSQWGGGGGGGGATAIFYGSGLTAGQTCGVTVGVGGAGAVSNTTSAGSTGGASTVIFNGTTISASGGVGGMSTYSGQTASGGAGGAAANGTMNVVGGPGGAPGSSTTNGYFGGVGGVSSFGGGGASTMTPSSGATVNGNPGTGPGSGGSGGVNEGVGGAGANGVVIFEWSA